MGLLRQLPPKEDRPRAIRTPHGRPLHLIVGDGRLQTAGGTAVTAIPGGLRVGNEDVAVLSDGRLQVPIEGDRETFTRAQAFAPSSADLARIIGRYRSDEAQVAYVVTLDKDGLRMTAETRPDYSFLLKPAYLDTFTAGYRIIRLVRGPDGHVTALRISEDRAWDMRFDRL